MAMLQVDLSEYDMLRETKNRAENEVKELKETIKGLKDKSRVIITTKYPAFDFKAARTQFRMDYESGFGLSLSAAFNNALSVGFNTFYDCKAKESSQYVGFEDIKFKVEEDLGKILKAKLEMATKEAEDVKKEYEEKLLSVNEENAKKWKEKDESRLHEIDELNNRIHKLESDNAELSKSLSQKQAEAAIALDEAQRRYNELMGKTKEKKESLIKRIFG